MSKEIAITVTGVSKVFKLPHEKADSIKSIFVNPFNKNRKKIEIQHALQDITFQVSKGEFFGIVGRNGSGKSTLLKIIAGIYQPTQGAVSINGRLVPFIELGVGFNPELTGRENVYLNGALMGFSESEIAARYQDIVDFSEIERFMDQKLKNYSSGMQVRLAFSVATILAHSDILLIDEVLAVGDADFQRKCFAYFKSLKKLGKTVIFVSHDMNAIREYCDRAVLINESAIVAEGTANKVAREYDKLFAAPVIEEEEVKENRWGNGSVKYSKIVVSSPSFIASNDNIIITTTVTVNRDIDDAIFGFSIKNGADVLILGNNSKLMKNKFEKLKKGDTLNLKWIIPSILGDGEYFINVAAESSTAVPYDWWDEAKKFSVQRGTPLGMVAYPTMELEAKRSSKVQ